MRGKYGRGVAVLVPGIILFAVAVFLLGTDTSAGIVIGMFGFIFILVAFGFWGKQGKEVLFPKSK